MTLVSKDEERLAVALELVEGEIWTSLQQSYPEVKSGDLSPETSINLFTALEKAVIEWLENNADTPAEPKVAEILLHRIEYGYRDCDDMELTPSDEEHIAYRISHGYREGELCTLPEDSTSEVYGYWEINNNP